MGFQVTSMKDRHPYREIPCTIGYIITFLFISNCLMLNDLSGDQDSVVPLLGSRTLIRELANELHFKITVPYGAWFHKGQVP